MSYKHSILMGALTLSCGASVAPQGTLHTVPLANVGFFERTTGKIQIDYRLLPDGAMEVSLISAHGADDSELVHVYMTGEGVNVHGQLMQGWRMQPDGSEPLVTKITAGPEAERPRLFIGITESANLIAVRSEPLVVEDGKVRPCAPGECAQIEGRSLEPPLRAEFSNSDSLIVHCFYPEDASGSIPVTCEVFPVGLPLEQRMRLDVSAEGATITEGASTKHKVEHRKPRQFETRFVMQPSGAQIKLRLRAIRCDMSDECKREIGTREYRLAVEPGGLHLCQGSDPKCPQ